MKKFKFTPVIALVLARHPSAKSVLSLNLKASLSTELKKTNRTGCKLRDWKWLLVNAVIGGRQVKGWMRERGE
jgi:hypothetical protein